VNRFIAVIWNPTRNIPEEWLHFIFCGGQSDLLSLSKPVNNTTYFIFQTYFLLWNTFFYTCLRTIYLICGSQSYHSYFNIFPLRFLVNIYFISDLLVLHTFFANFIFCIPSFFKLIFLYRLCDYVSHSFLSFVYFSVACALYLIVFLQRHNYFYCYVYFMLLISVSFSFFLSFSFLRFRLLLPISTA
jgi:hypothetical protein